MGIRSRREYFSILRERYQKAASKKERSEILDEGVKNTGIHRKSVIRTLKGRNTSVSVFHMLFLEGGFYEANLNQGQKFWWVDPPTDNEIKSMIALLAYRIIRSLKKRGYFQDENESSGSNEEAVNDELLPGLQAASVQSRIAMGERKGQKVRRLGEPEFNDFSPELKGPLCATSAGFSLHAAIYCAPWERSKLEKLCRYITRPALGEERLKLLPSGDIVLKLKTKYSDGTTHLLFSGVEFIEKLAALVPPPRIHLTRFFECLAPHSKIRIPNRPKT